MSTGGGRMPLVRISLMKGKPASFGERVGEIVYRAMVDTINVPGHDHFQVITQHDQHVADPGRRVDERGVVVDDLPDPSGLVCHPGPRRDADGDPLVELLPAEDREHRVAGAAAGARPVAIAPSSTPRSRAVVVL